MVTLIRQQELPIQLDEAWNFFSNPFNLNLITPPYMGFEIISPCIEKKIYAGMIIAYYVKPLFGIPLRWITEISHVEEPFFFVDDQKAGPFKFWHHQHIFRPTDSGILMKDVVHYEVGLGWPGRLVERSIVQPRVEEIFNFRFQKLEEIFQKANRTKK